MIGPLEGLMGADPRQRLDEIQSQWKQFPGRMPGGTGPTGLASNDAHGWSQMLNEQTEAAQIANGGHPLTVRRGHDLGGMPPNLAEMPQWWQLANAQGGHVSEVPQTALPPSIAGLYRAGGKN